MPRCPQCAKPLAELSRRCPFCMADLELLVGYVSDLQSGLERAEHFTKAGELGLAVWSYLEVLEVDPDNATARRQVGQVATAVRQFDRVARSRWQPGWRISFPSGSTLLVWSLGLLLFVVLAALITFVVVFGLGGGQDSPNGPRDFPKPPSLSGK